MEKFVSYDKMSKKEKKNVNAQKRNTWGSFNPVTRTKVSSKIYKRNPKHKKMAED